MLFVIKMGFAAFEQSYFANKLLYSDHDLEYSSFQSFKAATLTLVKGFVPLFIKSFVGSVSCSQCSVCGLWLGLEGPFRPSSLFRQQPVTGSVTGWVTGSVTASWRNLAFCRASSQAVISRTAS